MKDKIYNFKKIIRDNTKIIVPSIVVLLLLIIVFITLYFYKYNSFHKEDELVLYTYGTESKNEFNGVVSRNRKNEIISLDIDRDTYIGSLPIYNDDNKMIIFPEKMNIVFAINEFEQYGSNKYSYLYYDVNDYKLLDKGFNDNIRHSFLYDGDNVYFFLDKVNVKIGKEEIELGPLSMIIANTNYNILCYDHENDIAKLYNYDKQDVIVSNDYYKVNVTQDKVDYYKNNMLLSINPDDLKKISDK